MVSPFSSPRLFFFSALFPHALSVSPLFEEIMRQRIRAVSGNSARRGETARSRQESSSTRGYIRLRRFLRSHSYPCGNDKTDGARYFLRATAFRASGTLKSMRAVVYPLSPSLFPPRPSPSFPPRSGDDLFRTDSYHRRAERRRDFLTDVIVHSTMYFAR